MMHRSVFSLTTGRLALTTLLVIVGGVAALGAPGSFGATSARRQREQTQAFKDGYRLRSGIEATNSEYKRFRHAAL